MLHYATKRLISLALSLLAASLVIFAAIEVIPGDPASFMLGLNASPDTVAAREELEATWEGDGGSTDGGSTDGGSTDGGTTDGGTTDDPLGIPSPAHLERRVTVAPIIGGTIAIPAASDGLTGVANRRRFLCNHTALRCDHLRLAHLRIELIDLGSAAANGGLGAFNRRHARANRLISGGELSAARGKFFLADCTLGE